MTNLGGWERGEGVYTLPPKTKTINDVVIYKWPSTPPGHPSPHPRSREILINTSIANSIQNLSSDFDGVFRQIKPPCRSVGNLQNIINYDGTMSMLFTLNKN